MLVVVGLVLAGLLVAGLFGLGPVALRPRAGAERSLLGGTGTSLAILAGVAIVLLTLAPVAVAIIAGLGSADDPESSTDDRSTPPPGSPATSSVTPPAATTVTNPPATASDGGGPRLGPRVWLSAEDADETEFPRSYAGLDGLQPGTVIRVQVDGFAEFDEARAYQCVTSTATNCANHLDVQFGEDGRASFQYLVVDDFAPAAREGGCRAQAAPCSIVVEALDGDHRAELQTVFHDEVGPPGRITVTPATGVAEGQTVLVDVENYPAGAQVEAMLCAAPAATGAARCGAPAPTVPMTIGPDGRASAELVIRSGPVGRAGVFCGPGTTCGVSVASSTVFARAPVAPITFAGPAGADYDASRLGVGLAAAVVLLGFAAWLIRRTDWTPIGEEAAPEIDGAEYADLDAIVASLPPEDELEEVGASPRRAGRDR